MKSFLRCLSIFLFFTAILTGCKVRHTAQSNDQNHELSLELEQLETALPYNNTLEKNQIFTSEDTKELQKVNIQQLSISKAKTHDALHLKKYLKGENQKSDNKQPVQIIKNRSHTSTIIDRDNIFWRIGEGIGKVGLAILAVSGGILIKFGGGLGISLIILALGLIVLALSLPFFLLSMITTYMKLRAKPGDDYLKDEEI